MRYLLKAVNASREVVALELEAANELAVREAAQREGLAVLAVHGRGWTRLAPPRRRTKFRATLFSVELLALLEAGLNLVEALRALVEKQPDAEARRILQDLLQALGEGVSFSQAVARHPRHFPPLYVATVQSSERTGNVPEALSRYIAYREEVDRVRKRVVSALIYPAILAGVGALVLAFLLFYVVPRFAGVYEDLHRDLPLFSSLLLTLGSFVRSHGALAAAGPALLLVTAGWLLSRERTRAVIAERLWRVPGLGVHLQAYQLGRFYRSAGMLLRAGIPVLRTLDMVRDLLAAHLRERVVVARRLLEEGRSLSGALAEAGLATPVASHMMAVGERGGRMGEMLERIARFYDDETARAADAFTRVFEPLLMAAIGLAVGLVVVFMYMPVFELAGSIR